jgi:hypothetical protein
MLDSFPVQDRSDPRGVAGDDDACYRGSRTMSVKVGDVPI